MLVSSLSPGGKGNSTCPETKAIESPPFTKEGDKNCF